MRRNKIINFNPHRYDEHLSPFGRQVLKVLVKQWKTANKESEHGHDVNGPYQQRRHYPAQKRVLTFRDSNVLLNPLTSTPTAVPHQPDLVNYRNELNYDMPPNILFIENSVPIPSSIPTSVELVNTIETHKETPVNINLSSDDLIHSAFEYEQSRNIVHELYNRTSDDEHDVTLLGKNTDHGTNEVKEVGWNNMFDKELLPKIDTFIATNLLTTLQEDSEKEKVFKFPIPQQTNSNLVLEENFKTNTIKEIKTSKKVPKRKTQPKITDAIPKKVKKTEIDSKSKTLMKNSFRKQKYTKTVKNWLNDVDPNNPVDEAIIDNSNVNYIQIEPKAKENITEPKESKMIIVNSPKDKAMKVIQAQLINKGGVMKFGNPKYVQSNSDSKTVTNENENTEIGNIKEKKNKPKFIAPIKSQIAVKDVTYKINTVNGKNFENYGRYLAEIRNNDVIVILVYSNGFCQLNNHHTEDTCVVEGILINIDDDNFYFLKGTEKNFGKILAKLLNENIIICYEAKPLLIHLMDHFINFDINGNFNITDAKIGGSLVDPDNPPENFTELQKLLSFTPQYTIATECALQKSAWYSTILKECVSSLKTLLMENLSWNVFVEIEMRLLPIIADMERRGVCVDLEKLRSMEHILLAKIKTVEQECYTAAGKVFQINSTVQVRTILYDELQLDTRSNVKIRETIAKGAKSTSESMLRSLVTAHPLPKLILEYRHLHKAYATFLSGIAQHVKEGIVKPTWVQTAAATGRIASNNPNLQAIPKASFSLVMFSDAEKNDKQVLSFRSVYTSRPGYTFLAADFKHVECRVFAHAAADSGLLEALKSPDDLFKVLASKWLKKSLSEVSVEDRERTKRIVYASLYGAGTRKLMDILNVSYDQALSVMASFNRTFPALKSFGRSVVSRCSQLGGRLATLCGRGRSFKHISSSDFTLRSHAERQAVNFVVQGSAADLCKMAMVYTVQRLRETRPPVEGHLVLQIHDELVWEVADEDLERAAGIIKEVMESCGERCGMSVALPVAVSRGKDWADMTPLTTSAQDDE